MGGDPWAASVGLLSSGPEGVSLPTPRAIDNGFKLIGSTADAPHIGSHHSNIAQGTLYVSTSTSSS
jgi:hypothetical protein